MLKFLLGVIESDTYIETNLVVYQSLRTLIAKKNLEIGKKMALEKHFNIYAEHGFHKKGEQNIPNFFGLETGRVGKRVFRQYNSLQEYLAENTMVTGLAFEKLDYFFRIYFAIVIAIFLVNLVHFCVIKVSFPTRLRIRIWVLQKLLYFKNKIFVT